MRGRPWAIGATCAVVALAAASLRFLVTVGFNNDHFVHLVAAQQMLFGDWPTRDFIDIGRPLTILASAAAQRVIGPTLLSEALLVAAGFGLAAALTAATIVELTGSVLLGVGLSALEVAAFPRTYAYPKVLATALGLWLMAVFLRRPASVSRLIAMAIAVAVGFLFRHDLGLFLGLGGLVASVLGDQAATRRQRLRRALTFSAAVLALIVPYLLYVQLGDSLWNYVVTAWDQNQVEAGYVWPNPFAPDASAASRLLYLFHALPFAVLSVCLVDRRRGDWRDVFGVSVSVVAIAENFGLMRDLLEARVPDAVVPAMVLVGWLVHRAWSSTHRRYVAVPLTAALAGFALLVGQLGDVTENLNRAGLTQSIPTPSRLMERFADRAARLGDRFGSDPPSRFVLPLKPFFAYLDRCTDGRHRLFLAGLIPEVAYYARRPFAGGGYEHLNFNSETNQRRVLNKLTRETVPFVLVPSNNVADLEDLRLVSDYLKTRYVPLADVPVYEDLSLQISIDRTLPSISRDPETGWPCFL